MALIAAVLLVAGGGGSDALNGLTNGAILAATPFGILMVPMCYGLYKTLANDSREEERRETEGTMTTARPSPATGGPEGPTAPQMAAENPRERGQRRT